MRTARKITEADTNKVRTFVLFALVALLLVGGTAAYLRGTTPTSSSGVAFPLDPAQRELLAAVPADAESFAFLPSAAALYTELRTNPLTREPLQKWAERQQLPQPWIVGAADLVIWSQGGRTGYAMRLDRFRALLFRMYLGFTAGTAPRRRGNTFIVDTSAVQPAEPEALAKLLDLTSGLPPADALVVQRNSARTTYPPIARPAVTSVQVTDREIVLVSRAPSAIVDSGLARQPMFPEGALMTASFVRTPRLIGDLDRLFGAQISPLLDNGGAIVLYDVDAGRLLPRPKGLLVVPSDPEKRRTAERVGSVAEIFGEVRDTGQEMLIAFDRSSIGAYTADRRHAASWPATSWSLRFDAQQAAPVIEALGDNTGLRLAAPRLYRSIRDARRWLGPLASADTVEAGHSEGKGIEELRVRIRAK